MARTTTNFPTRKVIAGTLGGAITTILLWAAQQYILAAPLPLEVAGAILTIVTALVGYFVPPAEGDQVVVDQPSASSPAPAPGQVL